MSDGFVQLARPIQHALWDLRWEALRHIQTETIAAFSASDHDLLISAATASGKTEAAFLPIFSAMTQRSGPGVQAIYVGPLKALINDQFARLENLCARAELPVHRWHGDVPASAKQRLTTTPAGTLLITPESLESLLLNRTGHLSSVFASLTWVVIDEIHAFVGQPRGTHLRSLLHRLEHRLGRKFRMIGLSATVGDVNLTKRWFGPGRGEHVAVVEDKSSKRDVRLSVDAVPDGPAGSDASQEDHGDGDEKSSSGALGVAERLIDQLPPRSNLVFCNRKGDVESLCNYLTRLARRQGSTHDYRVHHGSLARAVREDAEEAMKSGRPTTTICSATLELGIDVGDVAVVGQLGAPHSVSSLIQRLGRSGRRDEDPSTMLLYAMVAPLGADQTLPEELALDLAQAAALVELMRQGWCEPPEFEALDLSTLTHQVLAVVAEHGGATAQVLFERLVRPGTFAVTESRFIELLRALGTADLIEQHDDGGLILGLAGERLVRHYSFYAVFPTPIEFRVMEGARHVGMIDAQFPPAPGDHLLLGGRSWAVAGIDLTAMRIDVVAAHGSKPPKFGGGPGQVHGRVHATMREVLMGRDVPSYLTDEARGRLNHARETFQRQGLGRGGLVELGSTECALMLWAGSRVAWTVKRMLARHKIASDDRPWRQVGLTVRAPRDRVRAALRDTLDKPPDPASLAADLPTGGKFDSFLSPELQCLVAETQVLEFDRAIDALAQMQSEL